MSLTFDTSRSPPSVTQTDGPRGMIALCTAHSKLFRIRYGVSMSMTEPQLTKSGRDNNGRLSRDEGWHRRFDGTPSMDS